jgi:16S rRNA (guanine527-N7)-methyltransferase
MPTADPWIELGWRPDGAQQARFQALQVLLREWNSRLNLTRLVEGDDYWIAQVFDSLWPLHAWLDAPERPLEIIDVGTGKKRIEFRNTRPRPAA